MKKIYMILTAVFALLSLSLNAQTRATENVTDHIVASAFTATNSNYSVFSGVTFTSDAVYAGNSALDNGVNIQLRSRNSTSGIVTTTSGGKVKSITITVASGTNNVRVYGKNTAYTSAADLYSSATQGTLLGSTSSTGTITVSGDYEYIGIRSYSGAVYLSSIDVVWEVDAGNTANLDLFSNTTDENMCLPVYGGYHDHTQHNQMVYPASLLTDMVGKKIKSMTFYPASVTDNDGTFSGINFYNGSVTFKMMEVTGSTGFNSSNPSFITGSMTTVKTVTMPSSANTSATTWKITFDQEYEYNGGDLVIDVTNTTGDYKRTYFYTGTTSIAYPGYYTYSGSTGSASVAVDYVPKVTFTYEVPADQHDLGIALSEPTAVTAGENATITATVTNNGNQTESGYTVTFSDGTNTFSTQTGGTLAPGATETFTATYTTSAAGTVTITANVACTGDADATNDEATATLTVTVPVRELTAPVDGTTVDVGNNSGLGVSVTIPVSGNNLTQDVTVSVSGAGFTVSPTTLSAADVNAGTATVTITYNGTTSGTGTLTFSSSEFTDVTVNLTGSYSTGIAPTAHGMVRMGTLRLVDQFAAEIPATNDHPYRYTYFLKLATRDTTSSPARVPVQHTGAEVQGYYTHAEMKGDTDPANFLEENIISAELDMNLSPASSPYFYTINSVKNGIPASVTADEHYESYLNVLQRREAGDYKERQGKYGYTDIVNPHMDSVYTAGAHDFFDYRKVVANDLGDFLSYVPIVWTKGIDRYYYTTDSLHNSYGAPIWNVTRGDVTVYQDGTVCQRQVGANGGWNASANYTVDGTDYSLYLVSLNAAGVLPKNSNVEYEPYMFRLWLHDETASLRNYTWMINNNWSTIEDAGAYTENDGKWKLLDTKMCENWGTVNGETTYHPDTTYVISINQGTSANPQSWQNNIGFVAPIDGFTPELVVRFYYKIKGAPDPTASGLRGDGDDDNVGYVVVRGVNPDPGTAVREIVADGEIESQIFYNVQGMQSDKPFQGINIVVTRYSNGATTTTKVRY